MRRTSSISLTQKSPGLILNLLLIFQKRARIKKMETTPPKAKKEKRLSKKEKIFIKEYAEHGNGTRAVLAAYDTTDPKVAGAMAVENLAKPRIASRLADAIPDELVIERIHDLLNKKETIWEKDPNT